MKLTAKDPRKKDVNGRNLIKYFKSSSFQVLLIGTVTVLLVFIIIQSGAVHKKYNLDAGDKSPADIFASRDVVNRLKAEQKAKIAEEEVQPVIKQDNTVLTEVFKNMDNFIDLIEKAKRSIHKTLENEGITKNETGYSEHLKKAQEKAVSDLSRSIKEMNIPLSEQQINYLVLTASDEDIDNLKKVTMEMLLDRMKSEITEENIAQIIVEMQNEFQNRNLSQDLKNIGGLLIKTILKPNRVIDMEETEKKRKQVYEEAYEKAKKTERVLKGEKIISSGDIITRDKLEMLDELNFIEKKGSFDYLFAIGIFMIVLLLAIVLILCMYNFNKEILGSRNDIIIICIVILITLLMSLGIYKYFSAVAVPIFIATMTISILLDLKLAVVINFILVAALSLITRGDPEFIYMGLISGTLSAFFVNKADQRSKLAMAGLFTGMINVLVIICYGIVTKTEIKAITTDSLIAFINGIGSIIVTIGILPFWESTFNVITPLKLMELSNPTQTLMKKMLIEAPGTYHHSLMVGNLAEVATESIGGNSLLARVGAYYHDIGKLRRPYFFKENQLADNPHDRMTANLSTLVITSHTKDGHDMAGKFKIPLAVKDIIRQHHGTTLMMYFYHRAKNSDKGETVKEENFRYDGPKPRTREAAVVMLADSVEAAVRSMSDRTEGKIKGLIRKVIKERLDDGQLDRCNLTLKELDNIAKAFIRVFSGYFHDRESYPDMKQKSKNIHGKRDPVQMAIEQMKKDRKENYSDGTNSKESSK